MDEIQDPTASSRILVIDDAEDIHRLLHKKLGDEGYEVLSAYGGAEGIDFAKRLAPNLVLLDLTMPDVEGFEVLRELKDEETTMHTPVILLSGTGDTQDIIMGLELGAVDFIRKPFDFAELRARVKSAMRLHKLLGLLAQRAQIDGLTGLWNRAYFDARLDSALSEASRTGAIISLAMCDIDRFKEINDHYGHPAGDAVLEGFARILVAELRRHDVACRYGGEEFAIIFANTSEDDAANVLERVRGRLEKQVWPNHPERTVTASFGLSSTEPDNLDARELVAQADGALYRAKANGRNRLVRRAAG